MEEEADIEAEEKAEIEKAERIASAYLSVPSSRACILVSDAF